MFDIPLGEAAEDGIVELFVAQAHRHALRFEVDDGTFKDLIGQHSPTLLLCRVQHGDVALPEIGQVVRAFLAGENQERFFFAGPDGLEFQSAQYLKIVLLFLRRIEPQGRQPVHVVHADNAGLGQLVLPGDESGKSGEVALLQVGHPAEHALKFL